MLCLVETCGLTWSWRKVLALQNFLVGWSLVKKLEWMAHCEEEEVLQSSGGLFNLLPWYCEPSLFLQAWCNWAIQWDKAGGSWDRGLLHPAQLVLEWGCDKPEAEPGCFSSYRGGHAG